MNAQTHNSPTFCGEMTALFTKILRDTKLSPSKGSDGGIDLMKDHVKHCERCSAEYNTSVVPPLPMLPKVVALNLLTSVRAADASALSQTIRRQVRVLFDHPDFEVREAARHTNDAIHTLQDSEPIAAVISEQILSPGTTASCIAAFRRMCHAVETCFKQQPHGNLTKRVLEKLVRSYLHDLVISVYGKKVNILHKLVDEKILELVPPSDHTAQGEELYTARWQITPDYIINRLWGVTLRSQLNKLFEGGLRGNSEGGTSLLVDGVPGAGKTMLALLMATSFAEQGFPAVYVATGDNEGSFLDRLAILGYRQHLESESENLWTCFSDKNHFTLRICDLRQTHTRDHQDSQLLSGTGKTLTVYIADPQRWSTDEQLFLHSFKRLQAHRDRPSCFVLDCLDDVWGDVQDVQAKQLRDMLTCSPNQIAIFLSSNYWPSERCQRLMQQKVDAHIRLTLEEREELIKDRVIEIVKCTSQGYIRGRHYFSIGRADEGVEVYLSTHARHSIWVKRKLQSYKPTPENWRIDQHFDLRQVMGNDVVRGSAILLRGKGATHRLPIGLSFLTSGLLNSPTDHVIFLSLIEQQEERLKHVIQQYPSFREHLLRGSSFNPRVTIGCRPAGRFGPERILDWLSREVRRIAQDSESAVRRVVISNMSSLWRSPLFQLDTMFIPALIKLLKNENVTALFIDEPSEQSNKIGVYFDVILATEQDDTLPDCHATRIRVVNSVLCNASHTPHQICRMRADANGQLDPVGQFYVFQLRPSQHTAIAQPIPEPLPT